MGFFLENGYILIIAPLIAALIIGLYSLLGYFVSRRVSFVITLVSTFISFIFSTFILIYCIQNQGYIKETDFIWFEAGNIKFYWGFLVDNLSALMMFLITFISLLVHYFSYTYMKNEPGFQRFFVLMNLFNFAALTTVSANNLFQTYVGWEITGVVSYLLIAFYYSRTLATNAAKKAFMLNRIGDFGLLAGIICLGYFSIQGFGSMDSVTLGYSNMQAIAYSAYSSIGSGFYALLCFSLLLGAIVKSAQFPLHTWLEDAMEAPIPVSTLIHAAVMVTLGVFLIARLYQVFVISNEILNLIAIIGSISIILGAVLALFENNIKKILAFSTISQLGYMFLALGAGAYSASIFHLGMHSFFKALLFLCAGAVIFSLCGQKNIKYMGGLRDTHPLYALFWLIGCISASGFLLSGFYSKEAILNVLLNNGQYGYYALALFGVFLTAFYMFRSYFLIFEGKYQGSLKVLPQNIHFLVPIGILALNSAFLGWMIYKDFGEFIYYNEAHILYTNFASTFLTLIIAAFGFYCAWLLYYKKYFNIKDQERLLIVIKKRFFVDRVYTFWGQNVIGLFSKAFSFIDNKIVERINLFISKIVLVFSRSYSRLQNGNIQQYSLYSLCFVAIFIMSAAILYFRSLKG